jgi:hypothetical protein
MSAPPATANATILSIPNPMLYDSAPSGEMHTAEEPDWTARRKQIPLNDLLNPTLRWAASLPLAIRPLALMNQFPRLANIVAASWKEPLSFRACLDDLLTDRRGGRKGLPPDIRDELDNLRRYYYFREFPQRSASSPAADHTS